jgi:ABC-type spermidine/putrescine transport system permease subunit II
MKPLSELFIGLALLSILGFFLNPAHLLMPDSMTTALKLALVLGFLSFLGLVWKEHAADERDHTHIQKSGRISFFAGTTVLVIGIVFQATMHEIDPWLVYALSTMVVVKLFSRIFHHFQN